MSPLATLFFEPLDVFVFRDHRPFMAGQHFLARSVFPLPSVFFGAIRAALFERVGVRFSDADPFAGLRQRYPAAYELLGDADTPGALRLQGPLLAYREGLGEPAKLLLPWPSDLDIGRKKRTKDEEDPCRDLKDQEPGDQLVYPVYPKSVAPLSALRWRSEGASGVLQELATLPRSGRPRNDKPDSEPRLLTHEGAITYARASAAGAPSLALTSPEHYFKEAQVLTKERRTGIMRSRAEHDGDSDPLTVEESMFYTVETWRFAPCAGFLVELALDDQHGAHEPLLRDLLSGLNGAVLRLGGKGHLARVTCTLDGSSPLEELRRELAAIPTERATGRKAYCLTPSLLDPINFQAVLGETLRLGGINLRADRNGRRGPRPLIGALAPGSVFFINDPASFDRLIDDADARGSAHGHPQQAGYGLHCLLPYTLPS